LEKRRRARAALRPRAGGSARGGAAEKRESRVVNGQDAVVREGQVVER
jgi:hypothetical protein